MQKKNATEPHKLLKAAKKRAAFLSALFAVLAVSFIIFFLFFWKIKSIDVYGCTVSSPDEIIAASGVKLKSHIYSISKSEIESNIVASQPYVQSVRIKRTLPFGLRFYIEEEVPFISVASGGRYLLLSDKLRVLGAFDSLSQLPSGVISAELPEISVAKRGELLIFKKESDFDIVLSVIEGLRESGLLVNTTYISASSRYDVQTMYKNKYTIVFGKAIDITGKSALAVKSISYLESNMAGVSGIVYASIPGECSFVITGTAE